LELLIDVVKVIRSTNGETVAAAAAAAMLLGCGDILLKNDLRSLPVVSLLLYVGADANENVSCCIEVRSRFLAEEEDMFVRGGVSVIIINLV